MSTKKRLGEKLTGILCVFSTCCSLLTFKTDVMADFIKKHQLAQEWIKVDVNNFRTNLKQFNSYVKS